MALLRTTPGGLKRSLYLGREAIGTGAVWEGYLEEWARNIGIGGEGH